MVKKINTKKNEVVSENISTGTDKKIVDLKIELLKNPTKRGRIKKEIARLLTMDNLIKSENKV
ncbi:hypothetical protein KAI32_03150 [Candidatus Pacearchaeota archaeon]|nr:hypothetical protein [Candidatus Pacearchaeota archaeon]